MNNFRKNFLEQHWSEKKIKVLRREEDKRDVHFEVDMSAAMSNRQDNGR